MRHTEKHERLQVRMITVLLLLLLTLTLVAPAFGQAGASASIEGTVTDSSGAVVPGATVKAKNTATNAERTTTTDASGNYVFTLLPVGGYEIRVEKENFGPKALTNIELNIGKTARVDVSLTAGGVTASVDVSAAATPLTETTNTTIGDVIENRRIVELPLNGRNFLQLTLLAGNSAPQQEGGNGNFDTASSGNLGFVVNGGRSDQNNYLIDGIAAVDHYFNAISLSPSIEAIQEFRVMQSSYSAEAGMFGSGQVNIATKSGTNGIHGSAFEFLRNDKLDARNFFDLPSRRQPAFRQNNFGGSVGGPLVKDKAFFFFTYEGLRVRREETVLSSLLTANERQGLFTTPIKNPAIAGTCSATVSTGCFPTQVISGQTFYRVPIAPVAQQIINRFFPVPNLSPNTRGLNHVSVAKRLEDRDQIVARYDQRLTDNNQFFGRYIWARSDQSLPFGDNILTFDPPPPPGFPTPVTDDAQNLALGLTTTLSDRLINEARAGWNYYDGKRTAGNNVNFAQLIGVNRQIAPSDLGFPAFTLPGISQFGDSDVFNPLFRKTSSYQFSDTMSWIKGRHTMKFGGDFRHIRFDTLSNFFTRGFPAFGSGFLAATGDSVADFLIDRPFSIVKLQGDTTGNFITNLWGAFFNDEWKVSSKLTMTAGLRYEVFPPIYEKNNRLAVFDQFTGEIVLAGDTLPAEVNGTLVTQYNSLLRNLGFPAPLNAVRFVTSKSRGLGRSVTKTDFGNVAPRLGLAFDVFGNQKTVVRTAYGIYNALRDWSASSDSRNLLPYSAQLVLIDFTRFGAPLAPLSYADMYGPVDNPRNIPLSGISPQVDMPIGYVQQYQINLQQQLSTNLVFEIAYVGSTGINLNRLTSGNPINPTNAPINGVAPGARPVPNFSFYIQEASGATSSYHGGFIRLEKRFADGLSFVASYTLSKAIDTVSSARENGGAPTREQDSFCLRCERGRSNFDTRHRFVSSFLYDLPLMKGQTGAAGMLLGGWQAGGIVTLSSGQPLTPQHPLGTTAGFRFPRPNVTGNPNLDPGQRDPARWFDPTVYVAPATNAAGEALPGNAGRNSIDGPGFNQVDFTLQKLFKFNERTSLQFRTEFFNLFNHPNFNLPDRVFVPGANGRNANPNFGVITTAKNSRQIQFGLKLLF